MIGCVAAACSGMLAFGLMQMVSPTSLHIHCNYVLMSIQDGIATYSGWRWIFIIEGILTVLTGAIGYFALVDFPDRAAKTAWRFLNTEECNFVLERVKNDRDDTQAEPFNLQLWARAGLDIKVWGFATIFFCLSTIVYAIAYFLPIILQQNVSP